MLDFSKLRKGPVKRPVTQGNGAGNSFIPTDDKNAIAGECGRNPGIYGKTDQNEPPKQEPDATLLQLGQRLQRNLQTGGRSSWAIFHALNRNAPAEEIALIAVRGLALVLNDPLLYKTVAEKYQREYGISLTQEPTFEILRN